MVHSIVYRSLLLLIVYCNIHASNLTDTCVVFAHGTGAIGPQQANDYRGALRNHAENRFFTQPDHRDAVKYKHQIILPSDSISGPNFPDAGTLEKSGDWGKSHWGQHNDAALLSTFFTKKTDIALGSSRGSAAVIRALGLLPKDVLQNIKIIWLESPFARLIDCINYELSQKAQSPGYQRHGYTMINYLPNFIKLLLFKCTIGKSMSFRDYMTYGNPIDNVHMLPEHAYIVVTATVQDKVVPCWSSIDLYLAIRKRNPHRTFLIVIDDKEYGNKTYANGCIEKSHDNQVNLQEGIVCQDLMQALRHNVGLDYNAECSQRGNLLIEGKRITDYPYQTYEQLGLQPTEEALLQWQKTLCGTCT